MGTLAHAGDKPSAAVTEPPDWWPQLTVTLGLGEFWESTGGRFYEPVGSVTDVFRLQGKGIVAVTVYPLNAEHSMQITMKLERLNFRGQPVTIAQQTFLPGPGNIAEFLGDVPGRFQDIRLSVESQFLPAGFTPPAWYYISVNFDRPINGPLEQAQAELQSALILVSDITAEIVDRGGSIINQWTGRR